MVRPRLEVGDLFLDRGDRYRRQHTGHLSLGQLKVMSAIERCRSAALGSHKLQCSGGGLSPDGSRWIPCRPGYLLPRKVLSRRFRTLMLEQLHQAHQRLRFFGHHQTLADEQTFAAYLAPLRNLNWYVHSKAPFAGPAASRR
jgi:hypothetical protein